MIRVFSGGGGKAFFPICGTLWHFPGKNLWHCKMLRFAATSPICLRICGVGWLGMLGQNRCQLGPKTHGDLPCQKPWDGCWRFAGDQGAIETIEIVVGGRSNRMGRPNIFNKGYPISGPLHAEMSTWPFRSWKGIANMFPILKVENRKGTTLLPASFLL